jgi:hypothetical protein
MLPSPLLQVDRVPKVGAVNKNEMKKMGKVIRADHHNPTATFHTDMHT